MSFHNESGDTNDDPTLSQRFAEGEKVVIDIESGKFPMKSLQPPIKKATAILEEVTRDVSRLGLFSSNETADEISTSSLKYLLLPCYLGILHHNKITDIDEKPEHLSMARIYYRNFITRVRNYGIVTFKLPWETEEEGEESLPIRDPSIVRTGKVEADISENLIDYRGGKIDRYRIQQGFRDVIAKAKKIYDKNNDDDGALRDIYIAKLRLYCYKLLDELKSIEDELPILEMMIKRRNVQADGEEVQNEHLEPSIPLKPFIIARSEQQKKVLGLGYPSIPTMTVDEWCQQRFGNPETPGPSSMPPRSHSHGPDEECQSEEENDEGNEEAKRLAQIRMDEYKDTHRRGWGNTHNKG